MIISEHDIKLVGYICAQARASEAYDWTYGPIGTAFFVTVPIEIPGRELEMQFFYYLVTCAHVINAPSDAPKLYRGPLSLALPHRDGQGTCERTLVEQFEIFPDWDLAIAPIALLDDAGIFPLHFERIKPPLLGMEIGLNTCSIGLFSHHPGKSRPRPFVRFGHLSIPNIGIEALPQANVHLIESRSWGGESGSPVFFYYDHSPGNTPVPTTSALASPPLLGMLQGHFPLITPEKDRVGIDVDVNAGVAIVIRAQDILSGLDCERFQRERGSSLDKRALRSSDNSQVKSSNRWDKAIEDAQRGIDRLKRAIETCREMKAAGEQWPGEKNASTQN